ncbi:hypothetical protein B0H17DRAFT_1100917 [Mycena rosella]|uniref:Uncharacterized protein n=1 Tax=Mycena rosella TaxID=1033263 RepID=A0AAD7CMG2_MYCRO|nr:hypothetical protein B0H17DRAFT_1100917 [Mycena rosella]
MARCRLLDSNGFTRERLESKDGISRPILRKKSRVRRLILKQKDGRQEELNTRPPEDILNRVLHT